MPRRQQTPKAHHWGQFARIKLPVGNGQYEYRLLGRWGEHQEAEQRMVAEWQAMRSGETPFTKNRRCATVTDLAGAFLIWAENYYQKRQLPWESRRKTIERFSRALAYPLRFYRDEYASEFGPLKLKACRQVMVDERRKSRRYINQLVSAIIYVWRWGVENEIVSAECHGRLAATRPLRKGHTTAPEGRGRTKPVPAEWMEAILPHLTPTLATMVQLQQLCAMRPMEVCLMRKCDIRIRGGIKYGHKKTMQMWEYRPHVFKGDHLDETAVQESIPLPITAQKLLQPYLDLAQAPDAYLFSAAKTAEDHYAKRRKERKTKRWPSHQQRLKNGPLPLKEYYSPASYAQAVRRACNRAGIPQWSPKQLRHSRATQARQIRGALDDAQAILRHKHASTSEIYAQLQTERAFKIAAQLDPSNQQQELASN